MKIDKIILIHIGNGGLIFQRQFGNKPFNRIIDRFRLLGFSV